MNSCYVLTLKDTLSTSDTLFIKLAESKANLYFLQDSSPNMASVQIATNISLAVILIVAICVIGFLVMKAMTLIANRKAAIQRRREELEDKRIKYYAEVLSRKLSYEDNKQKKINDLIALYLEILKPVDHPKGEASEKKEDIENNTIASPRTIDFKKEKDTLIELLKELDTSIKDTNTCDTSLYDEIQNELNELIKGYGEK